MEKRMKTAGILACIFSILFALPHFWWALGISLAFPGDFQTSVRDNSGGIMRIVGGLAVLAGIYAVIFTHSLRRRIPKWIVTIPAWIGAAILTLWGVNFYIQRVINPDFFAGLDASPAAIWGYSWYILFIVWGLSFGVAAFYFHRLRRTETKRA